MSPAEHSSEQVGQSPIEAQLAAPPESHDHLTAAVEPEVLATGRDEDKDLMSRPWVLVLLILHVGFLGIPFYWKTNYSVGVRLWIITASIVYTVVAVVFIYVMLRYIAGVFFG